MYREINNLLATSEGAQVETQVVSEALPSNVKWSVKCGRHVEGQEIGHVKREAMV